MNSRPQVSNQPALSECISLLMNHAAKHGTRAAIVATTSCEDWLVVFAERYKFDYIDVRSTTDRADRITSLLGSERLLAAIQLGRTPDYGLLAALAGTVKAGGTLLIGINTPADTQDAEDTSHAAGQFSTTSNGTQRLIRLAKECAQAFPSSVLYAHLDNKNLTLCEHQPTSTDNGIELDCDSTINYRNPRAEAEQNLLFSNACEHIETQSRSCTIIKGRRGRGKSTLLAQIARHLQNKGEDFYITAMHPSALHTYKHYSSTLVSHYVSPESINKQTVGTLFIDEAASFSLERLQYYAKNCQRLIICTTVEGYESSGRAFEIRLLPMLSELYASVLQLEPVEPWRWANGDPLEAFTDKLLLTGSAAPALIETILNTSQPNHALQSCRVVHISQRDLACNESLLAQVHALLSATHYQSSAKDLVHMLDAPSLQLWAQRIEHHVVAVLLLEHEGNIDESLHDPILCKARRLPNQLLPQLLAQTANNGAALTKCYARVLRIAVQPKLRRQGVAAALLEQASIHNAHAFGTDAIGASFAADTSSLAFWRSQGYVEFHRGYKANPRTGKRAVAMMKSLDTTTKNVLDVAVRVHQANEEARHLRTADSPMPRGNTLQKHDVELLTRFAEAQRSLHDTYAALFQLSQTTPLPMNKKADQSLRSYELELRQYVKQWLKQASITTMEQNYD